MLLFVAVESENGIRVGETNDEAWQRHLMEIPDDLNATIRAFNI
jgi:hypothetical protein